MAHRDEKQGSYPTANSFSMFSINRQDTCGDSGYSYGSLESSQSFDDNVWESDSEKVDESGNREMFRAPTTSCVNKSTPSPQKIAVHELEKNLEEKEASIKYLAEELKKSEAENFKLKTELRETQLELLQTQEELGRVNFEKDRVLNLEKHNVAFKQIFGSRTDSDQSSGSPSDEGRVMSEEASLVTDEEAGIDEDASCSNLNARSVQDSIEVSRDRKGESLMNIPTTAVTRSTYNNYKLLLEIIPCLLLASDVSRLNQWVRSEFSIQPVSEISEIFTAMDRKRIITVYNLDQLTDFFEEIGRFDVAYLIEHYLEGDYEFLRNSGLAGLYNIGYNNNNNNNNSTSSSPRNSNNSLNSDSNDRNGTVIPSSPANGVRLINEPTTGHAVSTGGTGASNKVMHADGVSTDECENLENDTQPPRNNAPIAQQANTKPAPTPPATASVA